VPSVVAASDYGVVNVRVRARRAGMLTPETWNRLCTAQGFDSFLAVLADTAYGPSLQIDRSLLTPRRTAYQIRKRLADAYDMVIESVPKRGRDLAVQLSRLFEIDNLKAILRGLAAGATWDQVRFVLSPLGSSSLLPSERMLQTGDIEKAIDELRDTPYYDTLSHALERYRAEKSLFPLEVALDLDYMRELWTRVNALSGEDYRQVIRIVGLLVDSTNLLWAIRYRVYHDLSEEETINYTLPFGYLVRDADIRSIASGGDMANPIQRLFPRFSDAPALLLDPRSGLHELEIRLQREIAKECQAAFLGFPFHLGVPVAYLLLKEYEVQDIIVLIEGKTARMPREALEPHLVLGMARPGSRST